MNIRQKYTSNEYKALRGKWRCTTERKESMREKEKQYIYILAMMIISAWRTKLEILALLDFINLLIVLAQA